MSIDFRPVADSDLLFLSSLYASTLEEEITKLPWSVEQKIKYVSKGFVAQHNYFKNEFGGAEFNIVLENGVAIGRMYVDRSEYEIRVIDVTLLPESRGKGVGQVLMKSLLDESIERGVPISLLVEKNSPAISFYRRLGFGYVKGQGAYQLFKWSAKNVWDDPS